MHTSSTETASTNSISLAETSFPTRTVMLDEGHELNAWLAGFPGAQLKLLTPQGELVIQGSETNGALYAESAYAGDSQLVKNHEYSGLPVINVAGRVQFDTQLTITPNPGASFLLGLMLLALARRYKLNHSTP